MRLGSVQLWRRRWSRRPSINRSVALQRGQCGVVLECFISPPSGRNAAGCKRGGDRGQPRDETLGRLAESGRERGSIGGALRLSTQTGGVEADRQTMQGC